MPSFMGGSKSRDFGVQDLDPTHGRVIGMPAGPPIELTTNRESHNSVASLIQKEGSTIALARTEESLTEEFAKAHENPRNPALQRSQFEGLEGRSL